jgi:hypothetical protein
MLTATFGFFECPICLDFYLVPDWKIRIIQLLSSVHVLCPGCKQTIQVRAVDIDTVHNTRVDYRPHATVIKIEPPIPGAKGRRDIGLMVRIQRKLREREGDFQSTLERGCDLAYAKPGILASY